MSNSLFENNGEYGFGMRLGSNMLRGYMKENVSKLAAVTLDSELKVACKNWLETFEDGEKTVHTSDVLLELLEKCREESCKEFVDFLLKNSEHLIKKSTWIIGGDGWAYDIGYGGLDHILAAGEDVNILVLDTEVYSNTGGQASKATQKGAVAQFAASGRKMPKKDLGMMAMSYGNVYVASVAMGANYEQYLKALKEAESYEGTSIIIAYAPCINHGLKAGMGNSMNEMKKAVECGYWFLYRYDPRKSKVGENPFVLDSKEPIGDYKEFLNGEVRFSSLKKSFPDEANRLNEEAAHEAKENYKKYMRLAGKEI
jgi:pyruvate-ferredoxin/flavodoxin oxidoreductase